MTLLAYEKKRLTKLLSNADLDRIENDAALGNSPLFFGEWSLATQWTPTDEFLVKWADAQKRAYAQDAGWIVGPFFFIIKELAYVMLTPRYVVLELQD